ncbi:ATP synthase subunit I [Methyloversatilis sp. XJ19-49]|uniref:ATP synthase subunit I n=1 Tax=Methyloversatilis sp. XJ19-49 TaxID=2963429 RepID=UPI00211C6AEA|nr:ATP synthase subunit I [Methyloversatilis sp. XJ19-49]MCQ9379893.1 ATP synthase subunit I [Methyloversatilis sp. XJ19-49]
MADAGIWAGAMLAGAVLGAVFFGGLWWTVQRGMVSAAPARWLFASLVVRTAVVLAGFHAVGAGQAGRLGVCLLGFLLARALILRATRPAAAVMGPPCA